MDFPNIWASMFRVFAALGLWGTYSRTFLSTGASSIGTKQEILKGSDGWEELKGNQQTIIFIV